MRKYHSDAANELEDLVLIIEEALRDEPITIRKVEGIRTITIPPEVENLSPSDALVYLAQRQIFEDEVKRDVQLQRLAEA